MAEADGDRVTWSYDHTYQLTAEHRSGVNAYAHTFSYDPVGNRLAKLDDGAATTSTYDVANRIIYSESLAGRTTYTYDASGNERQVEEPSGDISTRTWSYENKLVQLEQPMGVVTTYAYALVRRDDTEQRVTKDDGTDVTRFVWDEDRVVAELDEFGAAAAEYTLEPAAFGNLLSQQRAAASSYYHYDALGSTRDLTDAAEVATDDYTYDAFGTTATESGTTENPYRYVGREGYYYDAESGLYTLRQRTYGTGDGRFLSEDPVRADEENLYRYVGNDPVNQIDPSGLDPALLGNLAGRACGPIVFRKVKQFFCGEDKPKPCKEVCNPKPADCPETLGELLESFKNLQSVKLLVALGLYENGVYKVKDLIKAVDRFFDDLLDMIKFARICCLISAEDAKLALEIVTQLKGIVNELLEVITDVTEEEAAELALDVLQLVLGLLGMAPAIGIVADVVDIVVSALRKDFWGAAIGCGCAIPALGIGGGAANIGMRRLPRLMETLAKFAAKARKLLEKIKSLADTILNGIKKCLDKANDYLKALKKKIDELLEKWKGKAEGGSCFVAGTLVHTKDGLCRIEDVSADSNIWSFDNNAKEWRLRKVIAPLSHQFTGELVTISLPNEKIVATENHPFWVVEGAGLAARPLARDVHHHEQHVTPEGRWVEAGCLRVGDVLLSRNGKMLPVGNLNTRHEIVEVYNLAIEELRNYSVGEAGVLVHNKAARIFKLPKKWRQYKVSECPFGCENVADQIVEIIGAKFDDVVKIAPKKGLRTLGGFKKQATEWFNHIVVVKDGRVYDAFTGYKGLPIDDYKELWTCKDFIDFPF